MWYRGYRVQFSLNFFLSLSSITISNIGQAEQLVQVNKTSLFLMQANLQLLVTILFRWFWAKLNCAFCSVVYFNHDNQ